MNKISNYLTFIALFVCIMSCTKKEYVYPATGRLKINLSKTSDMIIYIYPENGSGSQTYDGFPKSIKGGGQVDLGDWNPGTYIVLVFGSTKNGVYVQVLPGRDNVYDF